MWIFNEEGTLKIEQYSVKNKKSKLNPEMILDTSETAENTTSTNSGSTDTTNNQENKFRESEQLHELKFEIAALT